jgi:hypothetical protein
MTQTWQPIETAPKDGTRIVALSNKKGLGLPSFIHWDDGAWCGMTYEDEKRLVIYDPTHWMPLPTPPTEETT